MIVFSAVSAPPMRGFVVRPFHNGEWLDDVPVFATKRMPIVGVVIRSVYNEANEDFPDSAGVVPLIHDPCYASELSGGMIIFNPDDYDDPAFAVVWCYWPVEEDDTRFAEIHQSVENEARATLIRQKRQAEERRITGT